MFTSGRVLVCRLSRQPVACSVDFELGPLVAEFGRTQHVTGPEVVPQAQRNSTHMSRWLRPSRSRIRRISLAHPAKFGFLADGAMVFTMSNIHSAAVGSSAVPTCCRSESQHPLSPQEVSFSGRSEDSPELLGRIRFYIVFCWFVFCVYLDSGKVPLPDLGKLFLT